MKTKKTAGAQDFKGGLTSYSSQIRPDILRLLNDNSAETITTMLDYYGLPNDFPGYSAKSKNITPQEKLAELETAFANDINSRKFIPYLQFHEFEALLFSDPEIIDKNIIGENKQQQLNRILRAFGVNPELINDSPQTAPSKRLFSLYPDFKKTVNGITIAKEIGLEKLREKCSHFDEWIGKLLNK